MESESHLGDKEEASSHEQQRKREREKGAICEASPPIKKRVRESDGEECELSHYSQDKGQLMVEDKRQLIVEDYSKHEAVTSELSEDEFEKPLPLSDQVGQPLKWRTDSVDSLDESLQSTENLSSCDVSLGLNETECESLESSLVCLGNSLEDISVNVLDEENYKNKSEVGEDTFNDHKPKAKKKKKKKKRKMSKADQESGENKDSTHTLPNYFVAFQVSDTDIHKSLIKVQEELLAYEPALFRALVDVATSHITLLIARLDDEEALSVACSALEDYSKTIEKEMKEKALQLTFSGVDHFSNNVLYARVTEDEHHQRLHDMADSLRQFFTERGVCMPNMKPFNPHLTIAKMSKLQRGKGKPGPRKIEPMGYANHKELHFGCQRVKNLQLLAMNHLKDKNRYFYSHKEIHFGEDVHENTDHTQCCFPRRPVTSSPRQRSFSTIASEDPSNIVASSVGFVTALAASLMIVYVVGKVSGRI